MKFDVLSVGDATIDTFLFIHEAEVRMSLNKEVQQLCVNYADKLPVDKIARVVAGNAANNAVGSARLGLKTAYIATLGDDVQGWLIKNKLDKERIDTKFVVMNKKVETNSSTVLSFKGERTILVFHADKKYSLPKKLAPTRFMYYTSVGKNHLKLNADVIQYVKKTGARLGYNPGTYQLRAGSAALKSVIAVCEVLFVNKEEASRILGEQLEIKESLLALHKLGSKIVVITDGSQGSYVYGGGTFYRMEIPDTKVVERTGAGDAFASGFMAALAHGKDIPTAMTWGTLNSSSVIMFVGPQAGLLTPTAMKKFEKKIKKLHAVEI
ncbi:MAG: carbohydrate kinase family protein [Candidatus Magasanikbacteria bacterium]|nr:carbohydrate kinase family protein [Candidatus Magasanikbacteria bacterium]